MFEKSKYVNDLTLFFLLFLGKQGKLTVFSLHHFNSISSYFTKGFISVVNFFLTFKMPMMMAPI